MSSPSIADIAVGAGRLARTHTRFYPSATEARGNRHKKREGRWRTLQRPSPCHALLSMEPRAGAQVDGVGVVFVGDL